ncbi:dynein beta chain, ciliary [Cyclospora cayetanensis]|uniref:Dynein-1, subspecies f n=1 Tax=Cyclospora cayetanensis TaxID=88456 RepID=A0A6P6RV69_9EIME|nr:dynein beta chain, ciliary [Cyclospora cayetanensis]
MEVCPNMLEQMSLLCKDIYLQSLCQLIKRVSPHRISFNSKEILQKYSSFLARLQVTAGAISGQVVLPAPPEAVTGDITDTERVHLYEECLLLWMKQIRGVLEGNPGQPLVEGRNPEPDEEISFWTERATALHGLSEQLQAPFVEQASVVLENNSSTYMPAFKSLRQDVEAAREEADENARYLAVLQPWIKKLTDETAALSTVLETFEPIFEIILLIWQHSSFYNKLSRIVVLIRQICNAVVRQAMRYISGQEVFKLLQQEEPKEALEKLAFALEVCDSLKSTYGDYALRAAAEGCSWALKAEVIFLRLDTYRERNLALSAVTTTAQQFSKLEKIEICGTKGSSLSASVQNLHLEFKEAMDNFQQIDFDPLSVDCKKPDKHFQAFRARVKDIEQRLASVLAMSFEDCGTISARLRLFDAFMPLLERPIMREEAGQQYTKLLKQFKNEIKQVHTIFLEGCRASDDVTSVFTNQPPVAKALNWTASLLSRLREPLQRLEKLGAALGKQPEELKDVCRQCESVGAGIEQYQRKIRFEWSDNQVEPSKARLSAVLLKRQEGSLLRVNFHPELMGLLREVRYMKLQGLTVPPSAKAVHERAEVYRVQVSALQTLCHQYNRVLTGLLPNQRPLLAERLSNIDATLEPGLTTLSWESEGVDAFIAQASVAVSDAFTICDSITSNLHKSFGLLGSWMEKPLFERKPKPMALDDADQVVRSSIANRLHLMAEDGKELHKILRDSSEALKATKAMGPRPEAQPLFEVKLELVNGSIDLVPAFRDEKGGICKVVEGWVADFLKSAATTARLDSGKGDYITEVKESYSFMVASARLTELLEETESKVLEYLKGTRKYEFLWKKDLANDLEAFIAESPSEHLAVTGSDGEPLDAVLELIGVDLGRKIPQLSCFDEKITYFEALRSEIAELKTPVDICWLRINAQPAKVQLSQLAKSWASSYTEFMLNCCLARADSVTAFINRMDTFLSTKPPNESEDSEDSPDKEALYKFMTHIRDVKIASEPIKRLLEPLHEQVALLRKHGCTVPDARLQALDAASSKWEDVIRKAFEAKEAILPLQNTEMTNIRNTLETFGSEVAAFRESFLSEAPFNPSIGASAAYASIDSFYGRCLGIEQVAKELNNLETLFDMAKSVYKELKDSKEDLRTLKEAWDVHVYVNSWFDTWKAMLWDTIDSDALLLHIRDMNIYIRGLSKEIKSTKVYTAVLERVSNMQVVLPLVAELHSEFMRDRHWKQLMTIAGQTFTKGPGFCLQDLMNLNLHERAADVSEIVVLAQKEARIDKKLAEITNTWRKTMLEFSLAREDTPLLLPIDDIVEVLEQHSVDLMTMISQGAVIDFCRSSVEEWQSKLRIVDNVLTVWMEVQRKWERLQPIFMQSDDIRSQLPEESKRFECADGEWRDMMYVAQAQPNVLEACQHEGREDLLNKLRDSIDTCEKALGDYLEQKKKAFARFYFVSNQALLDILANGTNPLKVSYYLGDCFDGISALNFEKNLETHRIASGMYSKEGEYVHFPEDYIIEGPVETYLANFEVHMRKQMRDILEAAKGTSENWEVEKPREEWLRDYCSQVCLVASQIMWTEEVTRCFEELEGGSENAMKDYKRVYDDRIDKLIRQVQQDLSKDLRTKIITLITIDVHLRDIVEGFIVKKVSEASSFQWQSQLRFHWIKKPGEAKKDCVIKICDWTTTYMHEFVGNCGRLVITPLTDRCYITLTQALNLMMGGAPAGPAGTGKTETTKDLSRAIGLPVFVFNCSDQMNYLSMAQIFMGLAQSGAWGCFDEFNRISIEVLSVVSTQVKCILDAMKDGKKRFQFMDEEINLVQTCGMFITMNPGYAGRTELPENLKALFRPCAMIVPDVLFICENMLMSEGFVSARALAHKFVTLYALCKTLLSDAIHYDWGLRAVKAVLRQAGSLKRADPNINEDTLLLRALRDFNIAKITSEDKPIFLRLIEDLFPGVVAPPKRDADFWRVVMAVTKAEKLQCEEQFILKCVQVREVLQALKAIGEDSTVEVLNPKAISTNELYGYMTPTKEWRDGAVAVIMRNMSKERGGFKPSHLHKWIVLDGDIDAEWIESMNTVMDDNKVLTLVSNERIPFTPTMRMIFEIADMKHASPATVSRGGVVYINEMDVGWKPFVDSWRETLSDQVAQSQFYLLFSYYFESNIEMFHRTFKFVCPMTDIAFVDGICSFVNALLCHDKATAESFKAKSMDEQKLTYEGYFLSALMWSVGACVADDKVVNYRAQFSNWLRAAARLKFPEGGLCFDYFFEETSCQWVPWSASLMPYEPVTNMLFNKIIVSTTDTLRINYVSELLCKQGRAVLLVGSCGSGKTTIVKDFLRRLPPDFESSTINLNSYTDSSTLQKFLESNIEKRTGHTYGPVGNKRIVYLIDDLNMPSVDKYDTQPPLELLRQLLDYGSMFDRSHLEDRMNVVDVQFMGCMNPTAGSFNISSRLQRHFSVITCFEPDAETMTRIYGSILKQHFQKFDSSVSELERPIILATIDLFAQIHAEPAFLHSAKKFHYTFNLRDLSSIFHGVLRSTPSMYRHIANGCLKMIRLWLHEASRVLRDRLICEKDMSVFDNILADVVKKHFPEQDREQIHAFPNVMSSFVSEASGHDPVYMPAKNMDSLRDVLKGKLEEYSQSFTEMNLVFFDDAILHVTRICRIIDLPGGNALLVGVGGSGKQSLSKLACFISKVDTFQIVVSQHYDCASFKADMQELVNKALVRPGTPHALLLTDQQIVDDQLLVYVNDLLASGSIPDLFARDEYEHIFSVLRKQLKQGAAVDTREGMWQVFIDKMQMNVHVILCHSPVGGHLRDRARKFPGLLSGTVIDQFHPWTRDALVHTGTAFLNDVSLPAPELRMLLAEHMANVHLSIDVANEKFLRHERRHNYTTPKSFLELIAFYKQFLNRKRAEADQSIERLQKGLTTLRETTAEVEGLREDLRQKMLVVDEKKAAADALVEQVLKASAIADEEARTANAEKDKANALSEEAAEIQKRADEELSQAMPAMERAREAVKCLTKPAIQELKSLQKPPAECLEVTKAVLIMRGEGKSTEWKAAQKMMSDPGRFLDQVRAFDAENMTEETVNAISPIISQPFFNFEGMKGKSLAAAFLANWVVNIVTYNTIYRKVKPLMDRFTEASESKAKADSNLAQVMERVREINEKVARLQQKMQEADEERRGVVQQAEECQLKLDLAERLVNGLSDENARWSDSMAELEASKITIVGDYMLGAAFVSYAGAFSAPFRVGLEEEWKADLVRQNISFTPTVSPLDVLADEADIALWKNEGLPADRTSIENAAIVTCCLRWPLLIDPQLQGIRWVKQRAHETLVTVSVNRDRWLSKTIDAIRNGDMLLVENLSEAIDPILDPLLSRSVSRKGRTAYIKIAGEDVEFNDAFRLILQTKLPNPHYKPEIAAQCTLVNFTVTPEGLEEQFLAMIVNAEQPDLETSKQALTRKQNEYKVTLAQLEDRLLFELSNANPELILSNTALVESLEETKRMAKEIHIQQAAAKEREEQINRNREAYRRAASEASMLYFVLTRLRSINPMYQYSLDSFTTFVQKAIEKAQPCETVQERCTEVVTKIRATTITWIRRGLFEKHKLAFLTMLTFQLLKDGKLKDTYDPQLMDFLLKGPIKHVPENPLADWLPNKAWYAVQTLTELPAFESFATNMEKDAPSRFKEWFQELQPEKIKLPLEWKALDNMPFKKLVVLRCLRPDRLTTAIADYIRMMLPNGSQYLDGDTALSFYEILESSFGDSAPTTPIFFILSPGADPVKEIEALGKKLGYSANFNLHNVALGQGQDVVAMQKLDLGHKEGHWVLLQNIHLMPKWTTELEKKLDSFSIEGLHPNFRCFLSSELCHYIPVGILDRSIKLTNEPPQGLQANLKRAFACFPKDDFDEKDQKVKAILFGLCFFHAVLLERKKFGPRGWNMNYPFSMGDLRDSAMVLMNYIDQQQGSSKVPWDDLKYIFGEIMYGGHIIDPRDRLDRLLDEAELFPFCGQYEGASYKTPPAQSYERYMECVASMPPETPLAFGLHPNTEIGYRTQQCEDLFNTLMESEGAGGNPTTSKGGGNESESEPLCKEILEEFGDARFDVEDISQAIPDEEKGPYQHVFLQECQCMNVLLKELNKSLVEVEMGFKGELTFSASMERLVNDIRMNRVPASWMKVSFASCRPLGSWIADVKLRYEHLTEWTKDPSSTPKVVNLSRLFNPQSFLTAIKEVCSQQHHLELNKLSVVTTVSKKDVASIDAPAREGKSGASVEATRDDNSVYICPVYLTVQRGPTFVFNAQLRTKLPPAKWILGGVAMILDVGGAA